MSKPPTVTEPLLGLTNPQIVLISVVFPAPFGPSKAKISPRLISSDTLSKALKPFL